MRSSWLSIVIAGVSCACAQLDASPDLRTRRAAVVYGADDRVEAHAHDRADLRDVAESVGALVERAHLVFADDGTIELDVPTIGEMNELCDGEAFAEQPALAQCSATLIADDLVLTAGHCMPDARTCRERVLVFGYRLGTDGALPMLGVDGVFECAEVVVTENRRRGNLNLDYAVFRLDRPAAPARAIASLRLPAAPLAPGDPVALVGFPSGAPMKIDDGGEVVDDRDRARDFFALTADAFSGSSGGAVFDAEGRVVGVLVRGQTDYVRRNGCAETHVIADPGPDAEEATYVELPIDALCARDDSAALCATRPPCPSGACDEEAPSDWNCAPEIYDDGYGCDCGCGAYDPDCDDALTPIFDCAAGMLCSLSGECVERAGPVGDWACNPATWADGTCDCGCGADPDCEVEDAPIRNCTEDEVCVAGAVCETPRSRRRGICASSPSPGAPLSALWIALALVRRRR